MEKERKNGVIIALDFPDGASCQTFLGLFREPVYVKIGMELFYKEGPQLVRQIKEQGHQVFLDLKLHDIPNTVRGGMRSLASLGADIINLHAAGGREMMEAAREGLEEGWEAAGCPGKKPLLIAVTQLTSTSQAIMNEELLIEGDIKQVILHYAENAKRAGLDGVVCSPLESPLIHQELGEDFLTVTPGIRFASNKKDDQKRVTTPAQAHQLGSSYIVVGRAISRADDPLAAYQRVKREFESGQSEA